MSESKDENEVTGARLADAIMDMVRSVTEPFLIERARMGGERAAKAMRDVLGASNAAAGMWRKKVAGLEADLETAQVTIRAMVGQGMPEDARAVMDPPAGHAWGTGGPDGPHAAGVSGRLMCITCTRRAAEPVLAAECLERAR